MNPNIDFSILKYKAALWSERYSEITQIHFSNSIRGIRRYILLFSVSDINIDSGYCSGFGMGIKNGSTPPQAATMIQNKPI